MNYKEALIRGLLCALVVSPFWHKEALADSKLLVRLGAIYGDHEESRVTAEICAVTFPLMAADVSRALRKWELRNVAIFREVELRIHHEERRIARDDEDYIRRAGVLENRISANNKYLRMKMLQQPRKLLEEQCRNLIPHLDREGSDLAKRFADDLKEIPGLQPR